MSDPHLLTFVGVAALLTISPGADTMLVMRNVLGRSQRAGLITTLGICMGLFVHATLSALGLSLILLQSAQVFEIVKLAGAGYLIFLGLQSIWQAMRHRQHTPATITEDGSAHNDMHSWQHSFFEGLLSNVLNPKPAVFYLAFLPQFIGPADPVLAKSLLLASIHFVMGIVWLTVLVVFFGKMKRIVTRASIRRKLEMASGAVLVALGVRLAFEHR